MPITYSTGGRVSLGRTSIALSNSETTIGESTPQGPILYTTTFNFSFLESNDDYIIIDLNGNEITSVVTEPVAAETFANYFIYIARANGEDVESDLEARADMPSHETEHSLGYASGYNSRTVMVQIPLTQGPSNAVYDIGVTHIPLEPAEATYSGAISANIYSEYGLNSNNFWGHSDNVIESHYMQITNVDTGWQSILYASEQDDIAIADPNGAGRPGMFGQAANDVILHRYENKLEGELLDSPISLLKHTATTKAGYNFNTTDEYWGTTGGQYPFSSSAWPIVDGETTWIESLYVSPYLNWVRTVNTEHAQTWELFLVAYPPMNGDWLLHTYGQFRPLVTIVSGANNYNSGLVISNSTYNEIIDINSDEYSQQAMTSYLGGEYMNEFPLENGSFNIPTESYTDLYMPDGNYYNVNSIVIDAQTPFKVVYRLTEDGGIADEIYESEVFFENGFIEIDLMSLQEALQSANTYYDINKVEVEIMDA